MRGLGKVDRKASIGDGEGCPPVLVDDNDGVFTDRAHPVFAGAPLSKEQTFLTSKTIR